ncbi:hypothetical protein BC827DRAFT_744790 [Russula dissimulans]|nr:hypothetical protein BC827DRAFT_744790 [Russula dissimulans]
MARTAIVMTATTVTSMRLSRPHPPSSVDVNCVSGGSSTATATAITTHTLRSVATGQCDHVSGHFAPIADDYCTGMLLLLYYLPLTPFALGLRAANVDNALTLIAAQDHIIIAAHQNSEAPLARPAQFTTTRSSTATSSRKTTTKATVPVAGTESGH